MITGNTGNNLLDGGSGADTLRGGSGNDIYIVDNAGDVVDERKNNSNNTTALTINASSGNFGGVFSADGQKVLFVSYEGAGSGNTQIIEENIATGVQTIISSTTSGTVVLGNVQKAVYSPDGTKVYFWDAGGASNLALGLYAKDLTTGVLSYVNQGRDTVSISADGNQIAFSHSSSAIDGDSDTRGGVFTKNLTTSVVTRITADDLSGVGFGFTTSEPIFSPVNNNKLLYSKPIGFDGLAAIKGLVLRDLTTGVETGVTTNAAGVQANASAQYGSFTADGTKVLFSSLGTNLVTGDTNNGYDIFLKDLVTGSITCLSTDINGLQANGSSYKGVLSADGKKVAFISTATNLAANDTNGKADVFVKDLQTGKVTLISTDSLGLQANADSFHVSFSPDGSRLLFQTTANNLVAGDYTVGGHDLFIKELDVDAGGTDTVQSSISYILGENLENLTLTGSTAINGTGNTLNNVITGNTGNNVLNGGLGTDTLNGGAGNDILVGGVGNDTYYVNGGDTVTELANEGTDIVLSTITYTLGDYVENLTLTGATAINGTGNTLNNVLTGNTANNTLTGGVGNDTMLGGAGNDSYSVDSTLDVVTESLNQGMDTVLSTVTYTLGLNVENLTLQGAMAINGTGNTLSNVITGNTGNNLLDGGNGNDSLLGGSGNDVLSGSTGLDTLVGGIGNDTLNGGVENDSYQFGRGQGLDTITDNDTTSGNKDHVVLDANVASDQLWFTQLGTNLDIQIIGTNDHIVINNWFSGSQYRVEELHSGDGKTLTDTNVQNLVTAMASMTPPPLGQTTLTAAQHATLDPVISASWS